MKIADRLRRLERRRDASARMSPEEIRIAVAEFDRRLASMSSAVRDPVTVRAQWRSIIDAPNPGWWQRIFADANPEDWAL
jgi:hypothetical protein